ncbi:MAG: integrase core domain-containing protein, partial [Pseudomonadota bacterium]
RMNVHKNAKQTPLGREQMVLVKSYGLRQEFITKHCSQQNGMMEWLIRSLKEQCVHRQRFGSLSHASRAISNWITFHNTKRPHQTLDMKSPNDVFNSPA